MSVKHRSKVESEIGAAESAKCEHASNYEEVLSARDRRILVGRLRSMADGVIGNPLLTSPEMTALLTVEPDKVYDRCAHFISATNLVSTLLVSGMLSVALFPQNVSQLEASKRTLGDIKNGLVTVVLVINVLQSLFTTYCLMELSTVSSRQAYRALARGGTFTLYQVLTYTSGVLICVVANLSVWISSSRSAAIWTCAASIFIAGAMHHHFFDMAQKMFPWTMSAWSKIFAPWVITRAAQQDIARLGALMFKGAAAHLPEAEDLLSGHKPDELHRLKQFVSSALPSLVPDRVTFVSMAMLREGLTTNALRRAAADKAAIFQALDVQDAELRRGERLLLAAAAADMVRRDHTQPIVVNETEGEDQ